ncbi:hypothetical protein JF546_08360 [Nitratireductor aquimarinus]|uniref:hypothetical protein n=1 Tax=Nitratireductor TaxID=245876 RepID=UPI0019D38734|nr:MULTISPECIES: hypothetical protein [Nitratireductor]MBN7763615.1 hypothetical protein [Nitratireductor aquibiodomus]MBN8243019.1 hypothetical protein [Nitratireductor aquimarinus]MBY6132120.1 hypothetical protein [Nitratireductor aquimarinus]MCA1301656.1 hypothetical protein [Nitratireductor aquimarinus]
MHDIILIALILAISAAALMTGDGHVLGMNAFQLVLFFSSILLAKAIVSLIRGRR